MRNIFKSFAAIAVAVLAIASCKNNELVPETPKGPTHTVKFTAGVPETKTNMEITQDKEVIYTWTAGDLERLTIYENGEKGLIDTDNSTITDESLVIYAIFDGEPSDDLKEYTAVLNGVVANQTPRVDDSLYDEDADVLIAKPITTTSGDAIEFQFRRVVAVNKMNLLDLPAGETLSTVTISSDKPIAGVIDGSDWAEELFDNTITLTVNKEIPSNGQLTLYYMAVPVEDAILTVDAKVGEDSYLKKFGKGLTTHAGDVKGYSVGLKKQAHIVLTENFNSDETTSTTYGGTALTADIASDWDYSWTFSNAGVYANNSSVRFGTGTANVTGYVKNSSILSAIPAGTEFSVKVYAAIWDSGTGLKVTYNEESKTATPANAQVSNANNTSYSADHFVNANTFIFTKVEGKNDLTIGNSTKRLMVDKVEVIYDGDAPSAINANDVTDVAAAGVVDATFNFSVVNIIGTPAVNPDGTVVTAASVEGNTVTYTVAENTSYKTREGSITIKVGSETKTVTVSQLAKVPSYAHAGTESDPYSVSDALLKIETLGQDESSDEVYVAGTIKSIDNDFTESYGTITYVIKGEDEATLQIFRGYDFVGVKFAAVSDLAVGQNVVVAGKLKDFSGTKEMDANNKLISVNGKAYLLKSISVAGARTEFDQGDEFSKGDAVVTASYRGSKDNSNVTASAQFSGYDGSQLGNQDITVTYTEDGVTKITKYQVSVADATPRAIHVADYDTSKGTVTVTANGNPVTEARIGTEIVVTVTTETGFVVDEFTVNDETKTLTKGVYQFTMDENDVTIAVTFKVKPAGYERVTSVSEVTSGEYVIAAKVGEKYYAMPTDFTAKPSGVEITVENNVIAASDAANYLWNVTKSDAVYTFEKGDSKLGWKSSTDWKEGGDNTTFNIALGTSTAAAMKGGTFAVKNVGSSRLILYNGTAFGAYMDGQSQSTSTYYYVELFKLEDRRTPQTLEFSLATGTYDIYASGTRSIPSLSGAMTTVTYSSSDEDVVTVNPSTGAVTNAKKVGHATITATAAANETYKSATAQYTLNIVDTTPKTDLVPPTGLIWTEGSKTLSWTDSNTSKGTYGTNYKYQYSVGDEAHYVDATSATGQILAITSTQTVYVKAVAITTGTHNNSSSVSKECTITTVPVAKTYTAEIIQSTLAINDNTQSSTYNKYKGTQSVVAKAEDGSEITVEFQIVDVMPNAGIQFKATTGSMTGSDWGTITSIDAGNNDLTVSKNGGSFSIQKTNKGAAVTQKITIVFTK